MGSISSFLGVCVSVWGQTYICHQLDYLLQFQHLHISISPLHTLHIYAPVPRSPVQAMFFHLVPLTYMHAKSPGQIALCVLLSEYSVIFSFVIILKYL